MLAFCIEAGLSVRSRFVDRGRCQRGGVGMAVPRRWSWVRRFRRRRRRRRVGVVVGLKWTV